MKKFLLSMLAVFAFVFAANAEEAVFDFNNPTGLNPSVTPSETISSGVQVEDMTFTDNGVGISFSTDNSNGVRLWTGTNSFYDLRLYKTTDVTLTAPAGSVITKIVVEGSNWGTSYVTFDGFDVSSMTWTGSESTVAVKVIKSTVKVNKISVTYISSDALVAPTITPNRGEYVEGDEVEVTITGAAGQDLYYALNSDDVGDAQEYTDPLKVTSTTTVYAWASDGNQTSDAASATFNFTAPLENIAAFYALTKGNAAKFTKTMTAVYQNGNNLIVKDDSGTMLVYGSVGQTYNNGDVIAAGVRGSVGEYGGNKQLSPSSDSFVAGTAGTAVAPVVKTVSELSVCAFLDYVKLEGVYFTLDEGKTKNYTVSDGTNTFAAYNQFGLTIEGLAEGVTYDIEGFVSSYNGNAQLQPISVTVADASGITGVSSLEETFSSSLPTTWTSVVVSGDVDWYAESYSSNYYAAMSAYKATEVPVEAWFISPALNVKDAELKTVSFKTQVNAYSSTDTEFKVYVLDNADITKANKTELTATLAVAPESGYSDWAESGDIDLSTYGDLVYVAFYYAAPSSTSALWCVDDFRFNVEVEEPEELGTKESPITVAEAVAAYVDGEQKAAWVTGYIVGSLNGSKDKPVFASGTAEGVSATNLLLADAADCVDVNLCVPVELPKGDVRTALNLVDNSTNLGKKLTIKCNIETYFSIVGLKGTSEYVLENSSAIECIEVEAENVPVEYYNLQGVKVSNPSNGIFIRKQGANTTKVVL